MEEQGISDPHAAQDAGRQERYGSRRTARRRVFSASTPPWLVEIAANVLGANQRADVFDGRHVAEAARVDELGAVVREHVLRLTSVELLELGLRLPHGDELDARAGDRRCPLRQLRERRVGGL